MDKKEKFIKDSLKDHESDLDIRGLWSDVESGLDKQEKKRRGIWFFLLPVFLLSNIGLYLLLSNGNNSGNIAIVEQSKQKIDKDKENNIKSNLNIEQEEETVEVQGKLSSERVGIETKLLNKSTAPSVKRIAKEEKNVGARNQILPMETLKETDLKMESNSSSKMENPQKIKESTNLIIARLSNEKVQDVLVLEKPITDDAIGLNSSKIISVEKGESSLMEDAIGLNTSHIDFSYLGPVDLKLLDINYTDELPPLSEIEVKKDSPWSLSFHMGSSLANTTYSATEPTDLTELITARNGSESISTGQYYGLRINYMLPVQKWHSPAHRFSLSSGVSRYKANYIFEGEEINVKKETVNGASTVINNVDGSTTIINGEIIRTTTTRKQVRNVNSTNITQVPLLLNYQYRLNGALSVNIGNGVGYNTLTSISGKTYLETDSNLVIGSIKESDNPKRIYSSYLGELGLQYRISSSWSFLGAFSYNYPLSDLKIEKDLKTELTISTASLALQYSF